jgi:hypothetical protein
VLALILTLSLLLTPVLQPGNPPWKEATELPARGQVTYYADGLMEWVYEQRLRQSRVPVCDPPACVGYVAMMRAGDLGRKVWLQRPGELAEGPFLVVDYAAEQNFASLWARGVVAEVDFNTARRWGMHGPLAEVMIWDVSPNQLPVFLPLIYSDTRLPSLSTLVPGGP